jgi:rhamnogalacturonyl hydrolase YesR
MLHEATHDHSYLDQAVATAKAALRAFGPAQLALQPIYFNSIYMRNLLLLGAATRDSRYRFVADRFAADEWNRHRDRHGLFMADPRGDLQLLDQAGMVQIYALLTVRPRKYF